METKLLLGFKNCVSVNGRKDVHVTQQKEMLTCFLCMGGGDTSFMESTDIRVGCR